MKEITEEQRLKNIQNLLGNLTQREREYWDMISPNSGVLNLVGKPGLFKTAILRSIAKKLNFYFIDLRLTTMDETDLGCYPKTRQKGEFEVIYYPIPEWAFDAEEAVQKGYNGVLISFEELNRASSFMRNAALKILLEKEIGVKFKFPIHVYMVATGNLGVEDKTDVEEFDTALLSRLITFKHNPGLDEWLESYANENIHKDILYFLKHNPSFYYPSFSSNDATSITNPRTWTFLSDFICARFGRDSTYANYSERLETYGSSYINSPDLIEFLKFTDNYYKVSYTDVLKNKGGILTEEKFKLLDRDITLRLINDLKELNVLKLTAREVNNLIKFLTLVEPDSLMTFIFELGSNCDHYEDDVFEENVDNNINKIINSFPTIKEIILDKVSQNLKENA